MTLNDLAGFRYSSELTFTDGVPWMAYKIFSPVGKLVAVAASTPKVKGNVLFLGKPGGSIVTLTPTAGVELAKNLRKLGKSGG